MNRDDGDDVVCSFWRGYNESVRIMDGEDVGAETGLLDFLLVSVVGSLLLSSNEVGFNLIHFLCNSANLNSSSTHQT